MKIPITAAWHALASISSTEWWVVMRLWLLCRCPTCENSFMPGVFDYLPYLSRTSHVLIIRLMQDWKSRPAVWEEGQSWKRGWEVRSEKGWQWQTMLGRCPFKGSMLCCSPSSWILSLGELHLSPSLDQILSCLLPLPVLLMLTATLLGPGREASESRRGLRCPWLAFYVATFVFQWFQA